jgi:DNA invertase Pin-like site-specific DNA recombinase
MTENLNLNVTKPATEKGQVVGYLRVSTVDQNELRQLEGLDLDRRFVDKCTGSTTERPELRALIAYVRNGDVVLVHSMDRLARNLDDLRRLVLDFTRRGVHVRFVKENLEFTGEDSSISNLLLSVMGAFAQFERDLMRERQREGIAIAKRRGAYKGRRPALNLEQIAEVRTRANAGESKSELAREYGITRMSVHRYSKTQDQESGGHDKPTIH